jgi:transcriptional regulator
MYLPKHFEQTDRAALAALMREHPLALLIVPGADGVTADPIPLEYRPEVGPLGTLRGHVARANPLWKRAGAEALAVFTGPQTYITPSWYPSKAETHKVVPTWNYTLVQARGPLRAIDDAPWLHALVGGLTAHHEAPRDKPWAVTDAPEDYVQTMLRAIVGIEIELTSLVGKWKVSQNRSEADRQGVVEGLLSNPSSSTLNSPTPNALAMSQLVAQKQS